MLNIYTKREVRYTTIEKGNFFVVVAFVVEIVGEETNIVSEPRIVKVIKKNNIALLGNTKKQIFLLPSATDISPRKTSIVSPFFSVLFGSSNNKFIIGLSPQPPTSQLV